MADPLADLCDPLLHTETYKLIIWALSNSTCLEADFEQIRSSPKHA